MSFNPGESVGPYRITEQLGQGGMASVFRAYHAALDRYVAIKALHPAFMEDPNFLARFQREARVIAKLEHPNIVPIYDFAEHAGRPYLVMKYIQGETLKARLNRGPLGLREINRVLDEIGSGLAYAHDQGILHRDIKPSNILIDESGSIFLADFGLARIAQAGESTLSSDMMLGTPQYISPEQAQGVRDLTPATDIYSFGVVLYEVLVGQVPFSADTPFSIIHDHIYTPLPLPSDINPKVPEPIQRALLKALAKEPKERYQSVPEMVTVFDAALSGVTGTEETVAAAEAPVLSERPGKEVDSSSTSSVEDAPKKSSRRRWVFITGGLLFACACTLAFLTIIGSLEEDSTASQDGGEPKISEQAPPPADEGEPGGNQPRPVLTARETVAANPEDPEARIALAQALNEAGLSRQAIEEARRAAEILVAEGDFPRGIEVLTGALAASGGPDEAGPELLNLIAKAMFLGANTPIRIIDMIEPLAEAYPEWELPPIITARVLLRIGEIDESERLLTEVMSITPDHPLARAVEAELLFEQGATGDALAIAEMLIDSSETPPWLREHLQMVVSRVNSG